MTRRVRGRVLFLYLLLSFVLGAALAALIWPEWIELGTERVPLADAAWGAFHLAVLHLLLLHALRRSGGSLRMLLGPSPRAPALRWAAVASVALVACAFASTVALYLPLSYVAPGFVEDFLLDESMSLVYRSGEHRLLANAVTVLAVVVGAPFVEELMFRGMLLPAWAERWSARRAVILTSLAFGLLHLDPLGTALFAVVTALAFLRSGGLWLPILVHAGNNLLAYGLELADSVLGGSPMTLDEFRSSWWFGVIGLAIGAPLLLWVLRHLGDLAPAPVAAAQPAAVS